MNIMFLFLFGVVVGIASGLLGIGGGILLVPGLMLLFGFSQQEAQGTSLAVLIPPIGLFAAMVYYQHGYVRLPIVFWIALGFGVGAFLGAKLVPHISIHTLQTGFGLLMLFLGFSFLLSNNPARPIAVLPAGISTLISYLLARLFFRKPPAKRPPPAPPSQEIEYRI